MRTHGNIVTSEVLDDFHLVVATFELDHHRPAFLHQAHRIVERLARFGVTHERHICDQERAAQSARNYLAVIDDVIDGHRHRRVVTLDNHAE